jgi:2-dehydro-3-deoxygluconokinase
MRAVCIGECMVELRPAEPGRFAMGFAGDVYNTAVQLKRQSPDLDVQFLTVTGDDALSAQMREAWRGEGVGETLAFEGAGAPGLYLIELIDGERLFHYWRSASPARGWFKALAAHGGASVLAGADLVYLSGISLAILPEEDQFPALDMLGAVKGQIGRLAFDTNLRPKLWRDLGRASEVIGRAAKLADILLPSLDDIQALGWAADDLEGEVALTAGASGCRLRDGGGWRELPAPAATVRDTSGAGDAFNAAYLAARLRGAASLAAAEAGLALAAYTVGQIGAVAPRQT